MRRWAALAVAIAIAAACSSQRRPPPFQAVEPDSGTGGTLPTIDASGDGPPLCGNTIVPVIIERPNLYFILDRSGSMAEKLPGSAYDKYENARIALGSVMRAIGHRVDHLAFGIFLDLQMPLASGSRRRPPAFQLDP